MSEVTVTPREVAECNGDVAAQNELLAPFVPKDGNIDGFRVAINRYVSYLNSVDATRKQQLWDTPIATAPAPEKKKSTGKKS
jgi:hypothetical protein